jgi:tetratricopeptide repeat protein
VRDGLYGNLQRKLANIPSGSGNPPTEKVALTNKEPLTSILSVYSVLGSFGFHHLQAEKMSELWRTCFAATIICLCSLIGGGATVAQQTAAMEKANELFNQSKWEEAGAAYKALTENDSGNGAAWQNLGECLLQRHKDPEAAAAFEHAIATQYRVALNQVNLARAYADAKEPTKALAELEKVVDSGKGGQMRPVVLSSSEFTQWKDDAEFQKLVEKMAPCRSAEYRQFDFWVGDWDVQAPNGASVGHNLVTLEQEGCLLVEHWTASSGGQTGTSFNYYDVRDKKWHQLYLDNSGNAGAFPAMAGSLVDGKMVLLTDETQKTVWRWKWYVLGPGKVRQMAEQSSDGEKTWSVVWDSVYVKIQGAANGSK